MKIQINHIGKMEGHADFVAEIMKGDVKSAKIMTTEGSRLIEGILVGRHFSEAPIITSRICGICPVVHKISSIRAIENAFKVKPSEQTTKLREIMLQAQIIHSHALHLFFLSLPDFYDLENDFDFISKQPKEAESAIKIREWALKVIEVIGGRAIHPIACEIGGFKVLPQKSELKELASQKEVLLRQALDLAKLVMKIKYPKFKRQTTYISLTNGNIKIMTPGKGRRSKLEVRTILAKDFTKNIKEIEEPFRAAKSAELDGEPFMVGALARINNNHDQLNPLAKALLKGLHLKLPQYNSFMNIPAQAIELVHCLEECTKMLVEMSKTLKPEESWESKNKIIGGANPLGKEVKGADAVEAPRGTLYHEYVIDKDGFIKSCVIITPTVSFLKNLEADIVEYLPGLMKMDAKKRSIKIRSLIRAYDPCISCATH
jgi:coenzyme F420-reducing hydrogenase alpha subunit